MDPVSGLTHSTNDFRDFRGATATTACSTTPISTLCPTGMKTRKDIKIVEGIVTISHPWQRDTGKYAAQGPNIMSLYGPLAASWGPRAT